MIKSKKRIARRKKLLSKKTLLPQWVVDWHTLFHYYPLEGVQAFFEGHMEACERRGYEKGRGDEAKGHLELLEWVKPIFREWQDSGGKDEITTVIGILEWKLRKEREAGMLGVNTKNDGGTPLPITPKGAELQAEAGGGSRPAGEVREGPGGGLLAGEKGPEESDKAGDIVEGQLGAEKEKA
jgi:hypothetical protein